MREESRRREAGKDWKHKKSKTQREPHGAHNHLHSGVPENIAYRKSDLETADAYLGLFEMQLQQSSQSFASLAVDLKC